MEEFGHDKLLKFLEGEASRRSMTLYELSEAIGLNPNQLYTFRNGRRPGLKVCVDISRYTHTPIDYILYLAGHITEEEVSTYGKRSPQVERIAQTLGMVEEGPMFEQASKLILEVLDLALFKMDGPGEEA